MRWPFARAAREVVAPPPRIDDDLWASVLEAQTFLHRLDDDARTRLRALCETFLSTKAINAAGGLELDDFMVASIATQAVLPVLELGLDAYPRFEEVIVYPSDFVVDRRSEDENGVVHEWTEAISGESWEGGPIILAWDAAAGRDWRSMARHSPHAYNVVIHEFTHKLDMHDGSVDGMPRLHSSLDPKRWRETLEATFDDFAARLDDVEARIPRHVDPESIRADKYYAELPLDAYAATDEAEFFSVSSEAFFVTPERLRDAYPDWYALLAAYYRQDPLRV